MGKDKAKGKVECAENPSVVVLAAGVGGGGGSIITSLPAGSTTEKRTVLSSPIDYWTQCPCSLNFVNDKNQEISTSYSVESAASLVASSILAASRFRLLSFLGLASSFDAWKGPGCDSGLGV